METLLNGLGKTHLKPGKYSGIFQVSTAVPNTYPHTSLKTIHALKTMIKFECDIIVNKDGSFSVNVFSHKQVGN